MSPTKFVAFNQTQYSRIIFLDTSITLLKHLDELFVLPHTLVAMPRAYDAPQPQLSTHMVVFETDEIEVSRLISTASTSPPSSAPIDISVLNAHYGNSAMVLPHRRYGLSTSEFRSTTHTKFFGNDYEKWDPDAVLRDASLVHFSGDAPIPKPWIMWPHDLLHRMLPQCEFQTGTEKEKGCRDREVWLDLYNSFRKKRKEVCRLLSVPAPEWTMPVQNGTTKA